MPEDILTIHEVADNLKVTEPTRYRLAQGRDLVAFSACNSWRFRCEDIECWISEESRGAGSNRGGEPLDRAIR